MGHFLPGMKEALNHLEYAGISIPMAVLIWIMIYPMMMKVDFKSIKNIGKNPKGLFVTAIASMKMEKAKTLLNTNRGEEKCE